MTATETTLDPLVKRIFLGFGFSALGSGLTMPFLYVYLSEVRGIPTATVGLLFAFMGLLGFLSAPVAGSLIDRFGPRPVMMAGLFVEALSVYSIGHVSTVPQAFAVATVMTVAQVGIWPASTAMLTRLIPESQRQRVYGIQFMLLNAGLGVGGVISALIIDTRSVESFQRLYLLDGLSYAGYIVVLLTLPAATGALVRTEETDASLEQPSWRLVLRDTVLLRVIGLSILAVTFGYAQFEAGFAAYTVDVADIPARALGLAYAANTGAIVVGQMITLRLIGGRRRSSLLALCTAIWAVSWVVIVASDAVDGWVAIAAIVLGLGLFGVGETLWAPIAPAIVNDLAREDMRGRYNALSGMTWTVATIIGPAFAGLLIGHGHGHIWAVTVIVGMLAASALFWRLRAHLTDAQDGLGLESPAETSPTPVA
ncbi:MAG TPA: MFS transporter [Marmoricola sp.]|nr:MFS transporter [Marmoricola sp.]